MKPYFDKLSLKSGQGDWNMGLVLVTCSGFISPSCISFNIFRYTSLLKFPAVKKPISCISLSASKSASTSWSSVYLVLVKWSINKASKPVYWFVNKNSYLFRSPYGCCATKFCRKCCFTRWDSWWSSRYAKASKPPVFKVCSSKVSDMKSEPFGKMNSSGTGE